jgi:hypothetical protein
VSDREPIIDDGQRQHQSEPEGATPIISPDLVAFGRSLTVDGDAARGIPACASCHNPCLTGMQFIGGYRRRPSRNATS